WELPTDDVRLAEIAAALGADVPACLASRTTIGLARGDRLEPIRDHGLGGTPVLLVNPRVSLATSSVFAGWDGEDRGALGAGDALAIARAGRNDLAAPAKALLPVIGDVLNLLADQPDVLLARMSGSGATCFALFDSLAARDAADAMVDAMHPRCWRFATVLR
ncbi:MAG: 4-(cytidine 5'-diphospho)-2-C-methyl-D-erythritol kinase, partial [Sphingomonadaceae bacterium]|nr:4-(cytidine 5'-diphospho)-2-C-methyl-D-erythritol kinase [Sphingomonadaceae bacterium]